ncbi:MAG: hypothetical protein P1U68_14140 [Verrucomicrobiales bacterium]|nr:hypothetical protein [Verrucomicrobiales bacterium]
MSNRLFCKGELCRIGPPQMEKTLEGCWRDKRRLVRVGPAF